MDVSQAGGQAATSDPGAAHLTFEDRYEETAHYVDRRKGTISIRNMDWEDIRQIVLVRVFTQYAKFDPVKGDYANWVNRVISNALRRLWRDDVGRFLRPCIKGKGCPHAFGRTGCSQTPSGTQCDECPLYRKWQTEGKYQARFPEPIELPESRIESSHFGEPKVRTDILPPDPDVPDDFDPAAAQRAINRLPGNLRRIVKRILRHGTPCQAATKAGLSKAAYYERWDLAKLTLARLYAEEKARPIKCTPLMDTKIVIEKGIALPPRVAPGGEPKYPFAQMEVGDSFFAPVRPALLYSSARNYRESKGCTEKVFASRKVEENGVPGARIWRVE